MNLTFQLIDPAGEALLLVHTPVPREAYADLTRRLLAIRELAPRQVAFLTAPTQGGVVRVQAAAAVCGGEVLRQAAFAFAVAREIHRERKVPVEGDGWPEALPAQVNPLTGQATLDFPLPQVQPGEGERGDRLLFPGVAWALQKGGALPSEAALAPALQALAQETERPAAGLLVWDFRAQSLETALWTAQDAALTHPRRCAAGGAAAAAWQALRSREGRQTWPLRQPGGPLEVTTVTQGRQLKRLSVAGPVDLGPVYTVEF